MTFPVRRVTVPQFELASNPTIRLGDVKNRMGLHACPVCRTEVWDVQEHIELMSDDAHVVLDVQDS